MSAGVLAAAMILDAALGEPKWLWNRLPHPAVVMGRAVGALDQRLNTGTLRMAKGALAALALVMVAGALGWGLAQLGPIVECICAAILLAQRSLAQHVEAVAQGLRLSLASGRNAVRMIVSRNVDTADQPAISRAAIESAAENLSDGVIAPAFWFALAGLPGIAIYKAVNTADSMIGYRTQRYVLFGKAAARLDDALNWIPARLTALLIVAVCAVRDRNLMADARRHRSPNAGWPEAAMARALNVALAGPRVYDGTREDLAWVNPEGRRDIGPAEIDAAVRMLWKVWAATLFCVLLLSLF